MAGSIFLTPYNCNINLKLLQLTISILVKVVALYLFIFLYSRIIACNNDDWTLQGLDGFYFYICLRLCCKLNINWIWINWLLIFFNPENRYRIHRKGKRKDESKTYRLYILWFFFRSHKFFMLFTYSAFFKSVSIIALQIALPFLMCRGGRGWSISTLTHLKRFGIP